MKRFLDLNEMEELRNDAYNNSNIAKQRLKRWHDQLVSRKEFQKGQRIGPFTIQQVYSNGVVELLNGTGSFKVNGQCLKPFLEPFSKDKEEINLLEPNQLSATLQSNFLSIPRPAATNLKKQPPPLTLFQPWRASEEAIQTRQYLARPGQVPLLLKIHLRPLRHRPFRLLRVGYPLTLLSADTRHGDHQLLRPLSHQYTVFHQREPGL
ncbi:hypothetical protein AAG906_004788 [Vitis piasezkii]